MPRPGFAARGPLWAREGQWQRHPGSPAVPGRGGGPEFQNSSFPEPASSGLLNTLANRRMFIIFAPDSASSVEVIVFKRAVYQIKDHAVRLHFTPRPEQFQ
jgi:hypothetical protein